jgi:glycosyltransferase involved in cell wall biosynthesis
MKIAIDARRLRDFGIGTYIRNLVTAMSEIDQETEYLLISFPDDEPLLRHLPRNFRPIPFNRLDTDRIDHIALPWLIRQLSPDLVHLPLNRVPLLMPKPYVVTVHDMGRLLFDEANDTVRNLRRFRLRRGLLRADRIIAVSSSTRRDIHNVVGVPEDDVRVVYNAPDPRFFEHGHLADARAAGPQARERESQRILERYQINYPFLLYAGNIRPQKNIPRMVEAFAVVRSELQDAPQYRDLHLIIIGDTISKYPSVRRAVIQSRVEHCVRFLGFVPFDTLRAFYELSTGFLFPSLYEGFGLPPLEAMAAGTPVLTSNVSSLPEVVGDAAILVNPENVFEIARGMKELLLNEKLRADLVVRGRAQAASFSWKYAAEQVIGIYKEVVTRSR